MAASMAATSLPSSTRSVCQLVCVEPRQHVLAPGHPRRSVELDVVVVPEIDQLAQAQMSRHGRGLRRDALLEVAIRHEPEDAVVDDLVARPVELGGEAALRDRHPDTVRESLAERTGRRLDAGRQPVFGVARRFRAPLAEALEIVQRDRRSPSGGGASRAACWHARPTGRSGRDWANPARAARGAGSASRSRRRPAPCPSARPDGPTSPSGRHRSTGRIVVDGQLVEPFRGDRHRRPRSWSPLESWAAGVAGLALGKQPAL